MAHSSTTKYGGTYKPVHSPRGTALRCQGWVQEAAFRLLANSLDEDVAEIPRELVAQGSTTKPLQNWNCYHAVLRSIESLENNETVLIQSGEPAGTIKTHPEAPRVLISGSSSEPARTTEAQPSEEENLARALFGQEAVRGWTYVGSQQAVHAEFETFEAIGKAHFGGELAGKLIVSGGMGSVGGAQPLAATLAGAAFLGIDVDAEKITRRIRAGACDFCVNSLDEALRILKNAVRQRQPVSVGLVGNCAEIMPELATRGVVPDVVTDLTGTGDLLNGYIPAGLTLPEAETLRREDPENYLQQARRSLAQHVRGMMELGKLGSLTFDFGNHLLAAAPETIEFGEEPRSPGFVSTYLQPIFAQGRAPLRCVALSGERGDIHRADDLLLELFPDDTMLVRWILLARKHLKFQGLPARVAWLGPKQRSQFADRMNGLVASGELAAPVVFARDQMICASAFALNHDLSTVGDASDEDRRKDFETMLSAVPGASWASFQGWRRNGNNYSCRVSQAVLADGSAAALKRLQSVLEGKCGFGLAA